MAISADLNLTLFLDAAQRAFKRKLAPLATFSTGIRSRAVEQKGDEVVVPYHPLTTADSTDFVPANGYVFGAETVDSRKIAVTNRKYQPLKLTSAEMARNNFDPEELGRTKGEKLAADVIADILSEVTAANFGAAAVSLASEAAFVSDDMATLAGAADAAEWPEDMRYFLGKAGLKTALMKEGTISDASVYGGWEAIRNGEIPLLYGLMPVWTQNIPANGENLVGFLVHPAAIGVAFSPITPAPTVREKLSRYEVSTDEETGLTLEFREWGDPDFDSHKAVIECNYGFQVFNGSAIKRVVTA